MSNGFTIKINGNDEQVVSVTLHDILMQIKNGNRLKWALLDIYAIGDLGNNKLMLDFEAKINESENGVIFELKELLELSAKFQQIMEITLIGNKDVNDLKRYSDDEEMYSKCDYTIQLIDSSYWIIHSSAENALLDICNMLPGVEFI
jgi:hypothetical protein